MPRPIRILIVDDDADVGGSLCAYMEDSGFVIRCVTSAADALAALEAEPFDVAIVDIRLPRMDGQTLILRAHAIRPATRFMVHTGSVAYRLPDSLMKIGMTQGDVFEKPVRSLELLADGVRRLAPKEADRV